MTRGDRLTLTIERPAQGGRMIARHEGAIALVAAAIPGEVVDAEVEKVQRGTIWATARRVLEPSPDRIDAGDWSCGGSVFAHIRYERQLALKRDIVRDGFSRLARLPLPDDIPIVASRVDGYRMRARLHVRDGRLGFFREGTHTLCDPAAARQLLPGTCSALHALELALQPVHRVVSDVEISENCSGTERACHLEVVEGADPSRLRSMPAVDGFVGATCAVGENPHTRTLWGAAVVSDEIELPGAEGPARLTLARHARSFFQGNRYLLRDLAAAVLEVVPSGRILDLYAGVGLFAIAAAVARGARVTAIEGDPSAAADLKANAARSGARVEARHQSVETFLAVEEAVHAATVIVDPPRTGVSRQAMNRVIALNAPRLIYVSCDVATLARDARLLADRGYALQSIRLFDLFPNTAHVESLVVFER